jgi:hypothetical protein
MFIISLFLASLSTWRLTSLTPHIVAYTIEILPYHLRAKGLMVFNFTLLLALIFNQYVNPIALGTLSINHALPSLVHVFLDLDALKWKYYVRVSYRPSLALSYLTQVIYCCWLVCETVFLWFCEFGDLPRFGSRA